MINGDGQNRLALVDNASNSPPTQVAPPQPRAMSWVRRKVERGLSGRSAHAKDVPVFCLAYDGKREVTSRIGSFALAEPTAIWASLHTQMSPTEPVFQRAVTVRDESENTRVDCLVPTTTSSSPHQSIAVTSCLPSHSWTTSRVAVSQICSVAPRCAANHRPLGEKRTRFTAQQEWLAPATSPSKVIHATCPCPTPAATTSPVGCMSRSRANTPRTSWRRLGSPRSMIHSG